MFNWLVSLMMLFGNFGRPISVESGAPDNSGNRHVIPADDVRHHNPISPADSDGGGKP